jgi:hypothetical protein
MNSKIPVARGPQSAEQRPDALQPSTPAKDERLLDEALEETFPASDPPAETQPGSLAARKAQEKNEKSR